MTLSLICDNCSGRGHMGRPACVFSRCRTCEGFGMVRTPLGQRLHNVLVAIMGG